QRVREEAHGYLVELVDDERVGEATREGHEAVGGDGSGDGDGHPVTLRPRGPTGSPVGPRRSCGSAQPKLSPQAQELPALGLSMVKPCFSIVSAKSIVAPERYGALIRSTTTSTPLKSRTRSPSRERSSKYSW